jgi:hypothetical protein
MAVARLAITRLPEILSRSSSRRVTGRGGRGDAQCREGRLALIEAWNAVDHGSLLVKGFH